MLANFETAAKPSLKKPHICLAMACISGQTDELGSRVINIFCFLCQDNDTQADEGTDLKPGSTAKAGVKDSDIAITTAA